MADLEEFQNLTKAQGKKISLTPSSSSSSRKKSLTLKGKNKLKSFLVHRIHILSWIGTYDKNIAISDFIAGVTLGLTMIPQSIAYAALANLPSQYGLYAAFIGSLIYVFFGSVKEVSIGPTSLMSLLTLQYTLNKPPEFAIVLAFLAGIVELLMGILKLGFIVEFISMPVTSAFTSATSLIIIGSQLKGLLGISYTSKGFADSIIELGKLLFNTKPGDSLLSIACIAFILAMRSLKDIPIPTETKSGKICKKIIWYISLSRNALIVLITSSVAYYWAVESSESIDKTTLPFKLSGNVEPGLPSFTPPSFSIEYNNSTLGFLEICTELGSGIIVVPLVAVLANVAIAKSFTTGKIVDATQEMLTLGVCNVIGSFFKSMPTCGAFTRSAVSQASGVRTPFAGLYSGTITILALSLLTPYFYYIPKATLSAVLICAVIFMIDFKIAFRLWRENRRDFYSWCGCITVCLAFGVEIGLLFGILLSVIHLLSMWARPKTSVKIDEIGDVQYIRIAPNVGLFFPAIDYLREKANRAAIAAEFKVPVVIDCSKFTGLDYTSAKGLENLAADINNYKQLLIIENLAPELQKYIDIGRNIMFCNKESTLREILTQESIRSGVIPLMEHIRASIDLGYKVDPLLSVESVDKLQEQV